MSLSQDEDTPTQRAVQLALLGKDVSALRAEIAQLNRRLDTLTGSGGPFVSNAEFLPIRATIYGLWVLIGTGFVTSILALVLR